MNDASDKLAKIDAMALSQRDLLIDICGDLPDLTPDALEFIGDVVTSALTARGTFDPVRVYAEALAVFRARRRQN